MQRAVDPWALARLLTRAAVLSSLPPAAATELSASAACAVGAQNACLACLSVPPGLCIPHAGGPLLLHYCNFGFNPFAELWVPGTHGGLGHVITPKRDHEYFSLAPWVFKAWCVVYEHMRGIAGKTRVRSGKLKECTWLGQVYYRTKLTFLFHRRKRVNPSRLGGVQFPIQFGAISYPLYSVVFCLYSVMYSAVF